MPLRQCSPVEVHTCPPVTMKKFVALQVATLPAVSSIRASSAPASMAWSSATTSWIFEWQFQRWSMVSGGGRLTCAVTKRMPCSTTEGSATLCSAMTTMFGPPTTSEGSCDGVFFVPRVTISRT